MQFQAIDILEGMLEFYQLPRDRQRFEEYLRRMVNQNNDQLLLPLPHFNPMGKEHVPEKLKELIELDAESILDTCCQELNESIQEVDFFPDQTIYVGLSLADDLMGAWTNKYSTDYGNTFHPRGMLNHQFATPIFWTAEEYTSSIIKERIASMLCRYVYILKNSYAGNLKEHLQQEAFVNQQVSKDIPPIDRNEYDLILEFVRANLQSENQSQIITFFYGDQAAESLGMPFLGFEANTGFLLAERIGKDLNLDLDLDLNLELF